MKINTIEDVNAFLDSIPKFSDEGKSAADFSLDRFKRFCESFGNPQNVFPSIHVAGSNGKGSTCNIIASVYEQAEYKVGLFTSPHLLNYSERFRINGQKIPETDLIFFFQEYLPLIKSFRLTYFEIATAIAFWWFAREKVDIAIIETGLGGRLDATNVITPLISVITSIALEHTDILGDTIQAIASEKAGIIKTDVPVVTGHLPPEATRQIKKAAASKRSTVKEIDYLNPQIKSGTFQLKTDTKEVEVPVPFRAPVQTYNAAMAWQVVNLLNYKLPISQRCFCEGLKEIYRNKKTLGRFEQLHPLYRWYFDGAHNVEAIKAMKESVQTVGEVNDAVLVLSLMKDKINKKMIIELLEFKKIVYYTLSTKRGAGLDNILDWLPESNPFPADQKSRHSLLNELKSELVIFGGSFYFYSTVKNWITTYL